MRVGRGENDAGFFVIQCLDRRESIRPGQVDIHEDEVWLVPPGQLPRGRRIGSLRDDTNVFHRGEHLLQIAPRARFVVHDECVEGLHVQ